MLIFLEATFHTTLPWTNHDHARRSLLYRYSPKYLHYAGELFGSSQPAWVSELTDVGSQAIILSLLVISGDLFSDRRLAMTGAAGGA
jgi:hypothetical protein